VRVAQGEGAKPASRAVDTIPATPVFDETALILRQRKLVEMFAVVVFHLDLQLASMRTTAL
jgi:hypothetical protein